MIFLHELIKTEMEIRCRRHRTVSLDEYLQRYPELGSADTLPTHLIFEEYRVRHRYGDQPSFETYAHRFPRQCEAVAEARKTEPRGVHL